jgi:hypothetical protein
MEQQLKHLWESISIVRQSCNLIRASDLTLHCSFSVRNIRGGASKALNRNDVLNSLHHIAESRSLEWCLIVAVSCFDGWLEGVVNRIHAKYDKLAPIARSWGYRSARPSFDKAFFTEDKAALNLQFDPKDTLIAKFDRAKRTRNLFVHQNGKVTQEYSMSFTPLCRVGKKLNLSPEQARESLEAILDLAYEVRKQLRRQLKKYR